MAARSLGRLCNGLVSALGRRHSTSHRGGKLGKTLVGYVYHRQRLLTSDIICLALTYNVK